MSVAILSVTVRIEHDTVHARQRARQIARLLGFDTQDQTRIATAVSEIARNAYNYAGGGRVEYLLEGCTSPQLFIVKVTDKGPGIRNLSTIMDGRYESQTGMGLGIIGASRLMDQFEIDSVPGGGTTVLLKKLLPRRSAVIRDSDIARIAGVLASERPQNAVQELQHQNHELLGALEEIQARQAELTRVNQELEDTNRGVVALYAELDEKADHLRRADELKSKFLSNMSHEFRSPLNSILALSGLLLDHADGDLSSEQNQQVGYIKRAANDLLELVNDLLDLAKVEAGKLEAKPIEFEVSDLFAALRGMLRPLLLNKAVDLVFEDASHIPQVYSDEGKVSQILRNFISNALKFTERGEVRVAAELSANQEIRFSVTDTGIGIAPQYHDAIFQDFIQIDHPIQRQVKGTGLGLPLTKKLAAFLGGRVEVRSQQGIGSTFTAVIPLRFQQPAEAWETVPSVSLMPEPEGEVVLLIEDSPEMVVACKSYLKGSGFQLLTAATTREARALLDHVRPSALVIDIVLRSEDTWAFIAQLKQDPGTKGIPIVVVSSIEDKAKAFHLGADRYLVKPIRRAQLLEELRAMTGKPASSRVLVIDDSELDRYLLKQQLRVLPVIITEESSGKTGIQRAREDVPDLIFLDLTMPDMTGFEVLEELKASKELAEVPVIIITSRILTEADKLRLERRAVGAFDKQRIDEPGFLDLIRCNLRGGVASSKRPTA
jgi:signal transduction histidine kinase/CheY-like chemotaxis protein